MRAPSGAATIKSLSSRLLLLCLVLAMGLGALGQEKRTPLAPTPPMGWNSWDGYGTTITEDQFKANAAWFAKHLKPSGWEYVVIDMEWFVSNPKAEGNSKTSQFVMDAYGRYTPAVNRFPSAGGVSRSDQAGFKPLADYVHSLGLKFGIHILRGIPKQAVEKNLPIEGSSFHAQDAADLSSTCPWNQDNYGLDSRKPAAQAYYDSIARLYASWEVDFIKVDCISSRPYRGEEIRMLSEALRKTGRPIVLSLSPGAAPLDKVDEMRKYAQMWRISDDVWDMWHSNEAFPQGLDNQFGTAAKWAGMGHPGGWPDADMLPFGRIGPSPGYGPPRDTKLSRDEQRTFMTLWCIFPSPLMVGGDLTAADDWTLSLLTNPEVIAVDQHSTGSHPVVATDKTVVWLANGEASDTQYLTIFNISDAPSTLSYEWKDLDLPHKAYWVRDLWKRKSLKALGSLSVKLPAHGSVLYKVEPVAPAR